VKFAFLKEHLTGFAIGIICDVLQVSRSGYYAWLKRPQSNRAARRIKLAEKIKVVHEANRSVYGSPRVYEALKAEGQSVSQNTVARVMRQEQIRPKTKRKFIPCTTDSNHLQPVAGNHLDRQFKAKLPNQKWVTKLSN
jgi:putative transposase